VKNHEANQRKKQNEIRVPINTGSHGPYHLNHGRAVPVIRL
jgi:hypothetical protein